VAGFFQVPLDLPLGERTPSRALGWVALVLIFVAVLAFAIAAGRSAAMRQSALEPQLVTVLLPVIEGRAPSDAEVERVIAALNDLDGVAFARAVTASELGLGSTPPSARVIDLAFNPGRALDPEPLARQIGELAPGARVAPGEAWPPSVGRVMVGTRIFAFAVGLATLAILVAAVASITRLSLILHRETIDLLRQLGAADSYIARQLEQHALGQVLRGGVLGFVAALLILAIAPGLDQSWLPRPSPLDLVLLGTVPVTAAVLSALAAGAAARWWPR
jgi:hypothetical protein